MKRQARQLSLIIAALTFAPAALAGSEIVKCIDGAGHVTLTDQPCSGNATSVRLAPTPLIIAESVAVGGALTEPEAEAEMAPPQLASVERHTTRSLLRQASWKTPAAPRSRPLASDVATLKAARLQMIMLDSARRQPALAVR